MDHVYEIKSIESEFELIRRNLKDRILISRRNDEAPYERAFTGDHVYFSLNGNIIASAKISCVSYYEGKEIKKLQSELKNNFEKVVFEKDCKKALQKDRYHTLIIIGDYRKASESYRLQPGNRWEVIGDIKRGENT